MQTLDWISQTSINQTSIESQSIFVMAGDPSADRHTAAIIAQLKSMHPQLSVWGVGGPAMKAAGMELIYNCQDFSVVGLRHGLKTIPFFRRLILETASLIKSRNPRMLLLVDFGSINLRSAGKSASRCQICPSINLFRRRSGHQDRIDQKRSSRTM